MRRRRNRQKADSGRTALICFFSGVCEDTDMNRQEFENLMPIRGIAAGLTVLRHNGHREDEGESKFEPYVGLEFDSAEGAQEFYNSYATRTGFRIRIGQLYRSRLDGSVISRKFVCSKEGFQTNTRTGCQAYIRVQKDDSGKWMVANINNEHNHELEVPGEICAPRIQRKSHPAPRSSVVVSARTGISSLEEDSPSGVIVPKRLKREDVQEETSIEVGEPYKGLEFNSGLEAYKYYHTYAASVGFRVRIGQLFRSKKDGSVTSRRFVCSKEGRQHPSRVGCSAFLRIQRQESGRWVVDRFDKEHNHEFDSPMDASKSFTIPKGFKEELEGGLENLDLVEGSAGFSVTRRGRRSNIGSDWYNVLIEYFQSRQAEDTGFFYAVEADEGKCMSMFWADSRSRFACSQFGDAIVFDTSYRRGSYSVPLASFVGINHHRQPVLLGCALIADDTEESFTWVFKAWLRAMSARHPLSIIADQDKPIQQSIAKVFPGTHHRFSKYQKLEKEQENLGPLLSINSEFKYEYEHCISQSQAANEFEFGWNMLLTKYNLKENGWLKDMYRTRKSWVPLYIKGTFFAGIPLEGSVKPYFGNILTPQTPLNEFVLRYEKGLEQRQEEEKKEDFSSFNLQPVLHTKDPIEEQCRRLYTITMFKVFQKELLECYGYAGIKVNVEGPISRYMVQKCGNGDERHTVAFNASNLNISCSCRMFEFEGVLCRHALKVFQIVNIRELPSRYILHRWTKNAKYGILRDVDSGGGYQDYKPLMLWSLREEARNYIEAGTTSVERYKVAFEMMHEGKRNLCWQN